MYIYIYIDIHDYKCNIHVYIYTCMYMYIYIDIYGDVLPSQSLRHSPSVSSVLPCRHSTVRWQLAGGSSFSLRCRRAGGSKGVEFPTLGVRCKRWKTKTWHLCEKHGIYVYMYIYICLYGMFLCCKYIFCFKQKLMIL